MKRSLLLAPLAILTGCAYLGTISGGYGPEHETVVADMYRSIDMSYSFEKNDLWQGDPVRLAIVFYNFSDSPVTFPPPAQYALMEGVDRNKETRPALPDEVFTRNPLISLGPTEITIPPRGYYRTAIVIIPGAGGYYSKPFSFTLVLRTLPDHDNIRYLFYSTNKDVLTINEKQDKEKYYR